MYRVKSPQGTPFRIWATRILKNYLKGYALSEEHLRRHTRKIGELESTVGMLSGILDQKAPSTDEATGLLRVITDYAYALDLLDRYDQQGKLRRVTAFQSDHNMPPVRVPCKERAGFDRLCQRASWIDNHYSRAAEVRLNALRQQRGSGFNDAEQLAGKKDRDPRFLVVAFIARYQAIYLAGNSSMVLDRILEILER